MDIEATPSVRVDRLPTFIIGGPRKTGTTALWSYLAQHPNVGMAAIKEPRFFTRQLGRRDGACDPAPPSTGTFDRGWGWYQSLFAGTESAVARGEASTVYFSASDAPELLAKYLPGVQLIFILRHPVDQVYSHYWQERRHDTSLPPFEQVVGENHPRLAWYLQECRYSTHLSRYRAHFAEEQLLVLRSEELFGDTERTVDRVCRFVGVESGSLRAFEKSAHNQAVTTRWPWLDRLLNQHGGDWMRAVPAPAEPLVRQLKWRVVGWNERPLTYAPLSPAIRDQLARELAGEVSALEEMTGWDLTAWRE